MLFSRRALYRSAAVVAAFCFLAGAGCFLAGDAISADTAPNAANSADADGSPSLTLERETEYVIIKASWPQVGLQQADEESAAFVREHAENFEQEILSAIEEFKEDEFKQDQDGESDEDVIESLRLPYELTISYEVSDPTPRAVCFLWNIWSYTGGAHGQLEMVSHNWDRKTGYPLLLEDLFADREQAVAIFSRVARERLSEIQDDEENSISLPEDMLLSGTEPDEGNFGVFTLWTNGIRLHFPPYQVGPWAAGPQSVDVTLEELKDAKPRLEFWEDKAS